jgi:hypothetical protein
MAFPVINSQPGNMKIISSLLPINFRVTEATANTVNVIAQVFYWNGSSYVEWGGKMRMANMLYSTTQYEIDISDLVAGLPQGDVNDINWLGRGYKCYDGTYNTISETKWNEKSDWTVRVEFQREYKDVSSGLIELDPDRQTSNAFVVHLGAAAMEFSRLGYRDPGSYSLQVFNHAYICGFAGLWSQGNMFLWMTDAPYQWRIPDVGEATEKEPEYHFNITKEEQFPLNFINGALDDSGGCCEVTEATYLVIRTYGNIGAGTQLLNTHTHTYYNTSSNSGYITVDVGWRTLLAALTPNANEGNAMGAAFNQVTHYYVHNAVCDGIGGNTRSSINVKFTINPACRYTDGDGHTSSGPQAFTRQNDKISGGTRNSYQRFMWRNKVGAWDMCSSTGLLKEKKKFTNKLYNKRNPSGSYRDVGDAYYQTDSQTIYEVTTQEMDILEAKYISCIGESVETYVRMELTNPMYSINTISYNDLEKNEDWRDNSKCNTYMPIVILAKSINVYKTSDNTARVKFSYYFANKEYLPRR